MCVGGEGGRVGGWGSGWMWTEKGSFCVNSKKKKIFFGGGGGGGGGVGSGGGGVRVDVNREVKIQKKYFFFFFWGGGSSGGGRGRVGGRSGWM